MNTTNRPFPEAVEELLRAREISQRQLAKLAQEKSGGFPHVTTLNAAINREIEPSLHLMEAIAKGLNISPTYFAEYRLGTARNLLDPHRVGLKRALRSLRPPKVKVG